MSPSHPGGARARRRRLVAVAVVLALLLGGYAGAARLGPLPAPPGWPPPSGLAEYAGALHVHSRYSHDGRGTVEEIAAAAARTGVRVVFLTDHNTLAPLADGKEGWHGPTLVLVGSEITTNAGYLLLLDPKPTARVGPRGELILLGEQDRSLWDKRNIQEGLALVDKAFEMRQVGPYQIQAAIAAVHTQAPTAEATNWRRITALYGELRRFIDTPIIQLNQAVAISMASNPQDGLLLLEPLADELKAYAPYHLARADMARRLGQADSAREAYRLALDLTQNQVERDFILGRIAAL